MNGLKTVGFSDCLSARSSQDLGLTVQQNNRIGIVLVLATPPSVKAVLMEGLWF